MKKTALMVWGGWSGHSPKKCTGLFDIGPYYLTCLVALLGPIQRVTGSYTKATAERTITSEPRHGEIITVEVPTHVTGILKFADGAVAIVITSFDVWASELPRIKIYGTEGTLAQSKQLRRAGAFDAGTNRPLG